MSSGPAPNDHPGTAEALPPGSVLQRRSVAVAIFLIAVALLIHPVGHLPGPRVPGLTAFFAAVLLVGHGVTAPLLFALAYAERSRPLFLLALGYATSALLAVPYLIAFPGALSPGVQFAGTANSAAWLFSALGFSFLLPNLAACILAWRRPHEPAPLPPLGALLAIIAFLVTGIAWALLAGAESLPALVVDGRFTRFYGGIILLMLLLHVAAAGICLLGIRGQSSVFAWVGVAHAAIVAAHIAVGLDGSRFTLGWSFARIGYTVSALVLLIHFVWLFAQQQAALRAANRELEGRIAARTADLAAMVEERDLLLREVYHRVRNNLQIVDSLIHFQLRHAAESARSPLDDVRRRIQALGLVHQQLMAPAAHGRIDLAPFLEGLCANIATSTGADHRRIRIETDIAPFEADIDIAAPLGMIVSELVTNAVRHAFPDDEPGHVLVSLSHGPAGDIDIAVTDNGSRGTGSRLRWTPGLGGRIVDALAAQLGGRIRVEVGAGRGTRVWLHLPAPAEAPPAVAREVAG